MPTSETSFAPAERTLWKHPDGRHRAIYRWRAAGPSACAIVFVHGFGEHMGRYHGFAERLSSLGMPIVGYDHLGHGHSEGPRGDAANVDALADDLGLILPELLTTAQASHAIIVGHSMGALTTARYLTRGNASNAVKGAVLSAPAFSVHQNALMKIKIAVGRVISQLWPTLPVPAGIDARGLSRDPDVVRAYRADPLVHGTISARLGKSLIDDGERFALDANQLQVPVLLYHGTNDPIASIEGSRRFAKNASRLLTYVEWPGFYHEAHQEVPADRERCFHLVEDWIRWLIERRPEDPSPFAASATIHD